MCVLGLIILIGIGKSGAVVGELSASITVGSSYLSVKGLTPFTTEGPG